MEKQDLVKGKKTTSFIGMPIYSVQKGKRIGSVKDVVYDGEHSRLLALTLEEPGLISPDRRILPYERIKSIGRDAIMIENEGILITEKEAGEDIRRLPQKGSLPGKKVITQSGNYLGTITDVLIDRSTGKSISYEVSGGITKDIGAGRGYVATPESVLVGEDAMIVPDETEIMLETQEPGGIVGAYQAAVMRAREYGGRVSEYTQEQEIRMSKGRTAGHDVRDDEGNLIVAKGQIIDDDVIDLAVASGKMHQVAMSAGVGATSAGYEEARIRVSEYTREQEIKLAKGRVAGQNVRDNEGNLILSRGQVIDDEVINKAIAADKMHQVAMAAGVGTAAAGYGAARERAYGITGEQLKGQRVPRDIVDNEGNVIVSRGTEITDEILAKVRDAGVMGRLVSAVVGERSRSGVGTFWTETRNRVSAAWSDLTESTRSAADRAARRRAESAQKDFLRGKISATDVIDDAGDVILHKDEVITPLVLDNLGRAGKLDEVRVKHEGGMVSGVEQQMEEESPEIHIVVESSEEHKHHKEK